MIQLNHCLLIYIRVAESVISRIIAVAYSYYWFYERLVIIAINFIIRKSISVPCLSKDKV